MFFNDNGVKSNYQLTSAFKTSLQKVKRI